MKSILASAAIFAVLTSAVMAQDNVTTGLVQRARSCGTDNACLNQVMNIQMKRTEWKIQCYTGTNPGGGSRAGCEHVLTQFDDFLSRVYLATPASVR